MEKNYKAGLIGCGDYLVWETDPINNSKYFSLKYTYDLDKSKAEKRAKEMNAKAVDSDDEIFNDPEIDVVLIFTPPWARLELFEKAAANKKHIIAPKPFVNNIEDAMKLKSIVDGKVECAVFYGRSGDPAVETLKKIFDSGEIGSLALYKEDWMHHYPTWNDWATDKEKNGGPFMDAMIHNLNKSRYLIGDDITNVNFFSDNIAHNLKCNDTEYMKLDFKNGAVSHLFMSWAADLDVYEDSAAGREHYAYLHMITNQGWYVEEIMKDDVPFIKAHKEGQVKEWKVEDLPMTPYDQVVYNIENGLPQNSSMEMAIEDIRIMSNVM